MEVLYTSHDSNATILLCQRRLLQFLFVSNVIISLPNGWDSVQTAKHGIVLKKQWRGHRSGAQVGFARTLALRDQWAGEAV